MLLGSSPNTRAFSQGYLSSFAADRPGVFTSGQFLKILVPEYAVRIKTTGFAPVF